MCKSEFVSILSVHNKNVVSVSLRYICKHESCQYCLYITNMQVSVSIQKHQTSLYRLMITTKSQLIQSNIEVHYIIQISIIHVLLWSMIQENETNG